MTDAPDPAALTEDMVMDKWAKIAPLNEIMTARIQNPEDPDWAVKPGSELADDDAASNPYQVSHCARACLLMGNGGNGGVGPTTGAGGAGGKAGALIGTNGVNGSP